MYVAYQVMRAPFVLDKEQRNRIAELEYRLAAREVGDSGKTVAESSPQPDTVMAGVTRALLPGLYGLLIALFFLLAIIFLFAIKNVYDQFPNPLSPTQMSDLANQLRNDGGGPQRVDIIRKEDPQSIALAEQFRQIFESAHWVLIRPPRPPNSGVILLRGLVIWHAPTDAQAFVFSRALHDSGLMYQVFPEVEMTNAGYFELTISNGWITPAPPRQ